MVNHNMLEGLETIIQEPLKIVLFFSLTYLVLSYFGPENLKEARELKIIIALVIALFSIYIPFEIISSFFTMTLILFIIIFGFFLILFLIGVKPETITQIFLQKKEFAVLIGILLTVFALIAAADYLAPQYESPSSTIPHVTQTPTGKIIIANATQTLPTIPPEAAGTYGGRSIRAALGQPQVISVIISLLLIFFVMVIVSAGIKEKK